MEQLTEIYYKDEHWHKTRMPFGEAYLYHKKRFENNTIYAYEENGVVLGYYERTFKGNTCYIDNTFIREGYRNGKVFKKLYRHFFATLPAHIEYIAGEKQKDFAKLHRVKI